MLVMFPYMLITVKASLLQGICNTEYKINSTNQKRENRGGGGGEREKRGRGGKEGGGGREMRGKPETYRNLSGVKWCPRD